MAVPHCADLMNVTEWIDSLARAVPIAGEVGEEAEVPECNICNDDTKANGPLVCMPCDYRHVFHTNCIGQWFALSTSGHVADKGSYRILPKCPICQKQVIVLLKSADDARTDAAFTRLMETRARERFANAFESTAGWIRTSTIKRDDLLPSLAAAMPSRASVVSGIALNATAVAAEETERPSRFVNGIAE